MHHLPSLYIAPSEISGRGVFTAAEIPPETLIETCPVVPVPPKERKTIHGTALHDYYFEWGNDLKGAALALGYGSLYNHSFAPNARYVLDLDRESIDFYSIKLIEAGQEITVNYNGVPSDKSPVWFDK